MFCHQIVCGRLPELIHDASAVPAALSLAATKALPVGAHIGVPVRLSDGSIFGTFCCFSYRPNPDLTERELAIARMFADLVAAYVETDRSQILSDQRTRTEIEAIINGDRLQSVYQTIWDLRAGEVSGFECLSRFRTTPSRSPDRWFSDAARVGLGVDLEIKALREGLKGLAQPERYGYVSFNFSPEALLSDRVTGLLRSVASDSPGD